MRNGKRNSGSLVIIALGIAAAVSLPAAEILGEQTQITAIDHVNFASGGLIRIDGSFGTLNVEAWDKPEVEVVVTKSLPLRFGQSKTPDQDKERLESIHIKTVLISSTELTITTTLASRHGTWAPPLPANTTNGVAADYEIHVPRDSRLEIRHGAGFVQVIGVAGDINAAAKRGDIMLWLPSAAYSIDARTRLGLVSSELSGATFRRLPAGERFTQVATHPSHALHLRIGFGGITIRKTWLEAANVASSGK